MYFAVVYMQSNLQRTKWRNIIRVEVTLVKFS